jgi:hypothetical protein
MRLSVWRFVNRPVSCSNLRHHDGKSWCLRFESETRRRSGTVGDAHDNAPAESFVDTFKSELITDRAWRTRSQLALAIGQLRGRGSL